MKQVTSAGQPKVATFPVKLTPGSRIGVAALSGVVDAERLGRGLQTLRDLGFEPVVGANLASREDSMAGSDEERLSAFHDLLRDASLEVIWFARGGYGLTRILPHVDWELLAETPRLFLGYSDLTPLLLEIERRTGWVTLHAPMVAADLADGLDEQERASLMAVLMDELPPPLFGRRSAGELPVEGVVRGGCLSMLTASIGTAYAPELSPILFLEDVDEPRYRIDRMLTQLEQTGLLAPVRCFAVGCAPGEDDVWARLLDERGLPYVVGLPAGHSRPNYVIALGAAARLTANGLEYVA